MRYNSKLQFVSGNGSQISINSTVIAAVGTCAQWLDDDHVIANTPDESGRWCLRSYDLRDGTWRTVDPRGANFLAAGGGNYVAELTAETYGNISIESNAKLTLVGTDQRGAAAEDGTVATRAPNSGGFGLQLRTNDGRVTTIKLNGNENFVARDVYVVGADKVLWRDDAGALHAHGLHVGAVAGPSSRPIYVTLSGEPWLVYYTGKWGIVAHPVDHPELGRVAFTGNAYHHDARVHHHTLWIGASLGSGELPGEEKGVDVSTLPITDLTEGTPADPVVAIGRDHWLSYFVGYPGAGGGWDTNNDPPFVSLPANSWLVTPDGRFTNLSHEHLGTYIHGTSAIGVEGVESQAWQIAPSGKIPIAYWDGRRWPRWPNLPGMSWLCLQAYPGVNESLADFEADIRSIINDPSRPQLPLVFVAKAYTNNTYPPKKLEESVPVYSRIVRDAPSIICTLVFNGNGRATGLQDNQNVIPLWQEYFNGITGTPAGGETPMIDWTKIHEYGVRRWAELDVQNKSQEIVNTGRDCRPFQKDCFVQIAQELYWDEGVQFDLFWKHGVPDFNNPEDVQHKLEHIGEDIIVDTPNMGYKDVVVSMGIPSASWNASGGTSPVTPGDENKCAPPPKPSEGGGEEPQPFNVVIHDYDAICSRSDPGGCNIQLEVEAVDTGVGGRISVWLEGSGEKIRPFKFDSLEDMHFFRGVRWKFGVPGTWPLIVEVVTEDGRTARSDGSHQVTVVA